MMVARTLCVFGYRGYPKKAVENHHLISHFSLHTLVDWSRPILAAAYLTHFSTEAANTMKIETPQILWHSSSEGDHKCAPLYSVSFLPQTSPHSSSSGAAADGGLSSSSSLLATAGNSSEIHLWHLGWSTPSTAPSTPITYVTALTRPHERSINAVAFSPHGIFLASAGDGGTLAIFAPASASSWYDVTEEKHVQYSLVRLQIEGHSVNDIMDLSWSRDDQRLVVGTLDHGVILIEHAITSNSSAAATATTNAATAGNWKIIWTNRENKNYVQGVAFDPLNVYVASQGSDRTVRVWARKKAGKKSLSIGTAATAVATATTTTALVAGAAEGSVETTTAATATTIPDTTHASPIRRPHISDTTLLHSCSKFEVSKGKIIKYAGIDESDSSSSSASVGGKDSAISNSLLMNENGRNSSSSTATSTTLKKTNLFADESTVEFFFRRLAWTEDGAFLITPAALWHKGNTIKRPLERSEASAQQSTMTMMIPTDSATTTTSSSPSFATYLFARHHFDAPYKVLAGLDKPSVVVRPNPVLFQLPPSAMEEYKENSPNSTQNPNQPSPLPYRSIFAVLTLDSILIYDTFHCKPLSISRGYHCSGLTDCSWSSDGHSLVVSSNDGYISILRFTKGELGEVYSEPLSILQAQEAQPSLEEAAQTQDHYHHHHHHPLVGNGYPTSTGRVRSSSKSSPSVSTGIVQASSTLLPPCEPGSSCAIVGPPCKKSRSCAVEDSLVSSLKDPSVETQSITSFDVHMKKNMVEAVATNDSATSSTLVDSGKKIICENKENEDGFVGAVTKLSLDHPVAEVSSSSSDAGTGRKHSLETTSMTDDAMMEDEAGACSASAPASKKAKKRIQPTHIMDA